ncbi:GDSL-type esterase/lipase family protein [Flavobacterium sp.]|jgi:LysM repeat protein|uniref:GDSL-type esterase/lipase family protein n=1 Tax=Flavobacterium sp. TaxID=239 RepID=UPI002A839451|nr:GDSL-type esterase/lipase family protein [Flavobacterium sp.]
MKNSILFFCLAFGQFILGQTLSDTTKIEIDSVSIDTISVVEFKNEIHNAKAIKRFLQKLDSIEITKKNKVRIVHIGDSHIQADLFSGKMRSLLQNKFGNAGLGFTFPYNLASTNGSHYIKYSSSISFLNQRNVKPNEGKPVGLSGIALYSDENDFVVELNVRDRSYAFNSIKIVAPIKGNFNLAKTSKNIVMVSSKPKVIYHKIKSGEALSIIADKYNCSVSEIKKANNLRSNNIQAGKTLRIPTDENEPVKITKSEFIPLNISEDKHSYNYYSEESLDKIYITSNDKTKDFSLNGLVLENKNSGIVYSAIGVNGAKCSDYLKYPLFFQQLQTIEADLVVISLGTNESFDKQETIIFYTQLEEMLLSIKKQNPSVEILLTTPPPSLFQRKYPNTFVASYAKAILEFAEKNNYAVWDMYKNMGGLYSVNSNANKGLMSKDKVHYSKQGYELQGELFFKALMETYNNYKLIE